MLRFKRSLRRSFESFHKSIKLTIRRWRRTVNGIRNFTFWLTVARFLQASHLQAVGYGALASSTLLDFGQRLARFMHLLLHVR
jgi:hypothetical protein